MPVEQVIAIVKDVLVAAASVVGASVAVRGLNTWNRQLKGGAEYELARRILKVTYRLRDAIKGVRHPVMWPEEMVMPAEGAAAKISDDEVSFDGTSRAYDSRWQKVADLRTELQTELLEAEVLWGNELGKRFQALYKLEHELMIAIRSWLILRDPKASEAQKNAVQKHQAAARDIMYDELSEEGDKFTKDVVCAIGPIEEYLKPHLRR